MFASSFADSNASTIPPTSSISPFCLAEFPDQILPSAISSN